MLICFSVLRTAARDTDIIKVKRLLIKHVLNNEIMLRFRFVGPKYYAQSRSSVCGLSFRVVKLVFGFISLKVLSLR